MAYFLEKIASHIYGQYANRLETQCMVFPNRRAGLYFLKYLSASAGKPVWAPAVKTINELFGISSSLKIAENETLVFELYKIYRSLNPGAESFDDFYFWGEMLVNDFDDADKYLADAGKLFENLADIRKIDQKFGGLSEEQVNAIRQFWVSFSDGSRSGEKNDFLRIWSILHPLYNGFRQSLKSKGIAYEGMIFRDLAEKCIEGHLPQYRWENFHFAGFNALNECEKILLTSMKRGGLAKFYWDYDTSYIDEKSTHSAGFFIRQNLEAFGNDMPDDWRYITKLSSSDDPVHCRIIETSSDMSGVKIIPELLSSIDDVNGENAHHTAIVLADESLLVPLLSTIPEFVKDVNVTMGYPLKFSPVYSLVKHLLSLQGNCHYISGENFFDHADVLNILRHSYFEGESATEANRLATELVSEKRQRIPQSRFAGFVRVEEIFTLAASPGALSEYLRSVLESFYLPGSQEGDKNLYSGSEYSIRNEFIYRTIISINRLDSIVSASEIKITTATWTRLLDRIIRGITIPFSGEPLNGIQIMGILETRALDFRNIIILSANEGVLPKSSAGSSYIPYSLREAYGLPGIKHQDSIYAYYFYRLLHRADGSTFIYNSNSEGIKTGEMSRFLLQLSYLSRVRPEMAVLGCEIISPVLSGKTMERNEHYAVKVEELFLKGEGKAISPSAVNTWLNCRMKFFYRYVCNLAEPDKILTEIDPAVFGALLHKIMQSIYAPYTGKSLDKPLIAAILNDNHAIAKVIREVIDSIYFNGKDIAGDGNIMIISNILSSYVRMILSFDTTLAPLRIIGLETRVYSPIEISYRGKGCHIISGGFIDRLDNVNGVNRILDYKTGNVPAEIESIGSLFDETNDKRNESWFQILMYCEIFSIGNPGVPVRPSLYALRNLSGKGYSDLLAIGKGKESLITVTDYSLIRKEYAAGLRSAIENILDPGSHFIMTEHKRKCEYCPYRQLCNR